MKCEATECGFTNNGLRIRAITDDAGSQVVVTDDKNPEGIHLLSEPCKTHNVCISLGYNIQEYGTKFYNNWRNPLGLVDIAYLSIQNLKRSN